MIVKICEIRPEDASLWDDYVIKSPTSNLYHLFGWKNVIEKAYGHKTYYLMAIDDKSSTHSDKSLLNRGGVYYGGQVAGILPLVHLKHFIFGNSLVSLPFFDMGGIIADDAETENLLLSEAIKLGRKLKASDIELRHLEAVSFLTDTYQSKNNYPLSAQNCIFCTRSHKVRMILDLPESSEILMKSFKSKLRSQVKKHFKLGLTSKIGNIELIDDFYRVFSVNMRDLGSPVHSKKFIENSITEFGKVAKIAIVYKDDQPLACSLIIGFKDTLENPWASALREYSRLSPNMLLYWTMLEYACDNGYSFFDFGRSSPDEGTYNFKEQWGAKPTPFCWHYIILDGRSASHIDTNKPIFNKAMNYWQKLPVTVTKVVGPRIRKHIGL